MKRSVESLDAEDVHAKDNKKKKVRFEKSLEIREVPKFPGKNEKKITV